MVNWKIHSLRWLRRFHSCHRPIGFGSSKYNMFTVISLQLIRMCWVKRVCEKRRFGYKTIIYETCEATHGQVTLARLTIFGWINHVSNQVDVRQMYWQQRNSLLSASTALINTASISQLCNAFQILIGRYDFDGIAWKYVWSNLTGWQGYSTRSSHYGLANFGRNNVKRWVKHV